MACQPSDKCPFWPDKPGDGTSKSLIVLNPRLTLISLSRFVEISDAYIKTAPRRERHREGDSMFRAPTKRPTRRPT